MDEHANGAQPTAVLYLRVSTPSQVKTDYDPEGISIPAQRESCLRKAAQLGAQVVEEYIEPGRTATSMDKRPAFQAMLERIRTQRDVTYVIVYKLSRMNRNRLDDAFVLSRLRKYKATLVSATESIDETPVGQLMHGILAAFNEYRSAEDGADIRYKMGEKAKRGGTLGRARLGYTNIRERFEGREVRTVVVDPERAPYVSLAFEMYATGQYSFERLAEELTARGLRTRPGRYPAGPVSDSKLQTMLRDRYYLGVITYDGVEYPGRHPALVSQELFDQVQSVLDASGVSGERRRTHDHYLKGTIWCDRCREHGRRHRLIITKATGRRGVDYFYFLCRGRQERVCDLPHLPMEHVEEAVLRYWSTQRLSEDFIAHVRKNLRTVVEEMTTSLRLMSEQLTTELARIDRQEENLLDLAADGSLPSDKVRTRLTRLKAERKEIQGRLANSDDRLGSGATVLEMQLDLLEHPQELYRQLTDHGRRLLNQAVFYELFVEQDQEDLTIQVVGQTYTEPVRDLMLAARAYEQQLGDNGATNANRPALNGEPVRETLAGLLEPVFSDRGWSKTAMVELRGLEPLTPTLPVWCATSCATAPHPARQDRSVIVHTSRGPSRIAGTGGWWHSEAAAG
jgi:site-specific DNA recombinase